jgi:cytochrome c oxidase subunit IV
MEHSTTEITFHHEASGSTRRIWRTFWLLLGITVVELILGLSMYAFDMPSWLVMFIKGIIVILTLAKAFYIVSIFMHLGDEIRNLIMTIVVPLLLFVWFIAAFLWDGSSYRSRRNRYDTHYKETTLDRKERSADTSLHPLD